VSGEMGIARLCRDIEWCVRGLHRVRLARVATPRRSGHDRRSDSKLGPLSVPAWWGWKI